MINMKRGNKMRQRINRRLKSVRPGIGRGRSTGDKPGSGPGGYCVCPKCGHRIKHTIAEPCNKIKCPKCESLMTKE